MTFIFYHQILLFFHVVNEVLYFTLILHFLKRFLDQDQKTLFHIDVCFSVMVCVGISGGGKTRKFTPLEKYSF